MARGKGNGAGRPPHFSTVEALEKSFEEYKKALKDPKSERYDDVPDIESFCDFVGAWRQLFQEYDKKPKFSTTIKKMKNYMYNKKKQLAMKNKLNATVYIFDAKNNHDYVDKQEIDQTSKTTLTVEKMKDMSDEDLLSMV